MVQISSHADYCFQTLLIWAASNLHAGQTKVLVSISGPIEVQRRDELIQETTIDIQFRPVSGFASPHEKILELQLREFVQAVILRTLNPRSLVQIVVQVLSIDTESFNRVCWPYYVVLHDFSWEIRLMSRLLQFWRLLWMRWCWHYCQRQVYPCERVWVQSKLSRHRV